MDKLLRSGLILLLICTVVATSGCEPLRKKFVRKKKSDDSQAQAGAIFDPIDYPPVVRSTAQVYLQHYTLWRVWYGDLVNLADENINDKKARYTLGQMQEQLSAMRPLVKEPSQKDIDECLGDVTNLVSEFAKPNELRNKTMLTTEIRSLGRKMHDRLSVEKVKDQLVETPGS